MRHRPRPRSHPRAQTPIGVHTDPDLGLAYRARDLGTPKLGTRPGMEGKEPVQTPDPVSELLTCFNELNSNLIDELRQEPSPLEFMRYVARNTPFVVRGGASSWEAVTTWNASYLEKALAGHVVNVAVTPNGCVSTAGSWFCRLTDLRPTRQQKGGCSHTVRRRPRLCEAVGGRPALPAILELCEGSGGGPSPRGLGSQIRANPYVVATSHHKPQAADRPDKKTTTSGTNTSPSLARSSGTPRGHA